MPSSTTTHARRVIVLGMPCDEKWRTEAGVALGGPPHLLYDIDYVPLKKLNVATAGAL